MGEQIYLTAEEARKIALTSTALKNHLYKQIREFAKECMNRTFWSIENCPDEVVSKLVADLTKDGYKVQRDMVNDPDFLIIEW